jgi:hypothetical protein
VIRGTFHTDDGHVMRLTLRGSDWEVEDGSIRKATSSGPSALDVALQAAARSGERIVLGADDNDRMQKANEGESLDDAFERVTRRGLEGR